MVSRICRWTASPRRLVPGVAAALSRQNRVRRAVRSRTGPRAGMTASAGGCDVDVGEPPGPNGWYRSSVVAWSYAVAGVVFFVVATPPLFSRPSGAASTHQVSAAFQVVAVAVNVAVSWVLVGRCARTGIGVGDDGVVVRNVRRSVYVPWQQVASFEVGRRPASPLIGVVRRTDDSVVLCFGIQRLSASGQKVTPAVRITCRPQRPPRCRAGPPGPGASAGAGTRRRHPHVVRSAGTPAPDATS